VFLKIKEKQKKTQMHANARKCTQIKQKEFKVNCAAGTKA